MAINIWQTGGQPTSFNPLPANASITGLPMGDYEISFKAKSNSGATLRVTDNGNFSYVIEKILTPIMTEYKISLGQKKENRFYIFDLNNKQDIIIEDINLVERPMGKATINGLEGFGTVKEGFTGKMSATTDFSGKVSGSMVENPNRASHSTVETTLKSPSFFTFEPPQSNYDSSMSLDNNKYNASRNQSGVIAQQLFSFNVIDAVEKQVGIIPASDIAGKIAWLTDNIGKLSVNWSGYGSSPTGYKATFRLWFYGANAWGATTASHTGSAVAPLVRSISSDIGNTIGSDGIVHALAYAEASDGVTSSSISTDYVSVTVEMKQSSIVNSKWTFHPQATLIDNETFKLDATNSFQASTLWVDVLPNTTYTWNMQQESRAYVYTHEWDVNGAKVKDVLFTTNSSSGNVTKTFTTSGATRKLQFNLLNTNSDVATYTYNKPMFNMGGKPVSYEPKRGERMVMPTAIKNLVQESNLTLVAPSTTNVIHDEKVYLKLGKTYTLSAIFPAGLVIQPRIGNTANVYGNLYSSGTKQSMTFVATDELLILRKYTNGVVGTFTISELQIEEGNSATNFEPYDIQINAKPSKLPKSIYKPTDFKLPLFTSIGDYSFKVTGNYWYSEGAKIPVLPNTEYTYSFRQEVITGGACYTNVLYYPDTSSGVGSLIGESGYSANITSGISSKTFTTPPNCYYIAMRVGRANNARTYDVNYYDFTFGLKSEMTNKTAFGKPKNIVQKSDFKETQTGWDGLAKPLTQYGSSGYSISDDAYIPNTKSQRITWTSSANNGVGMLNRGLRLTQSDPEFSDLALGETYVFSFYGKGWEDKAIGMGWYSVNLGNTVSLASENVGNGWYRYSYRFQYTRKDGAYIYIRPNYNYDYSYDCLMNGLQIEVSNSDRPTPYVAYKPMPKPSYRGLTLDGKDDFLRYQGFADFANRNFTIESTFTWNGTNAVDNAQQTIFSCGDIRFGINNYNNGYVGVYTPSSNWITTAIDLRRGVKHKMKAVYTPTSFSLYVNDVLIETRAYTGTITPYSQAFIGNLGGGSYFFNGIIHTLKVTIDNKTAVDLDFNTPAKFIGSTLIDNNGGVVTILGNPTQLNKLAKR